MTLREEIHQIVEDAAYVHTDTLKEEKSLVRLFKKWALELVGEDAEVTDETAELIVNAVLKQIRQRIEQATEGRKP